MFNQPAPPPKNLKQQCKQPLKAMDISMPHSNICHGHRAREPNTDHAAQWMRYRQRQHSAEVEAEKEYRIKYEKMNFLAKHEEVFNNTRLKEAIKTKLKNKIEAYHAELDKRRDRLKDLLADEEEMYVRETVEQAQKADDNKLADMKKRSQELKEAKEAERLETVKQKRIQQYSKRCYELRPFLSRKQTQESKDCQLQQMRENEARRQSEKEIDSMWDDLQRKQDEAFLEREVQEAIIKFNKCRKDTDILTMQIRAKKTMQEQQKELERQNELETQKIRELERQRDRDVMQQQMEKRKEDAADLQQQIAIQQQFANQRKKEEEALDNAFAKLAALELQREQAKVTDNKDQLRKEMETYKHHLAHLKQQRAQDEKELETLIVECRKEDEQKQIEGHCKFVEHRRKLQEQVLKERAQQVVFNKQKAEKELEYKKDENRMMREIFEMNKRMHDEADRIHKMEVLQYRSDLSKQIQYNYMTKKREMEEIQRRLEQGLEEERKLEEQVKELFGANANPSGTLTHPFRRTIDSNYDCHCK